MKQFRILVIGAGEQASGVIHHLWAAGHKLVVTEIPEPRAIRRGVSFSEAVYEGEKQVGALSVSLLPAGSEFSDFSDVWDAGKVPLVVDSYSGILEKGGFDAAVDATISKKGIGLRKGMAPLTVALGPGYVAGEDVDAVVETLRGPTCGEVLFSGRAVENTGVPAEVCGYGQERVLRALRGGQIESTRQIGESLQKGDEVLSIDGACHTSAISGVLRGLIRPGSKVRKGEKLADVDPRGVMEHCFRYSDKSRALGAGVLEALAYLAIKGHLPC